MRRVRLALTWLALGVAAGVVGALALPLAFHARPLTVLSGSMEPALMVGDVVVVREADPLSVAPGDIVTFRDPGRQRLITHRVRHMRREGGMVHFVTRGDANKPVERWQVPEDKPVRRVLYRVPLIGYALNAFHTRLGLAVLVGLPILLLAVVELWSIWRPETEVAGEPAT